MTFRILTDGKAAGAANMARDEEFALELGRGGIPPTVRIYGWDPPAVSIGYHQPEEDIDRASLERAGIDLVRRPTGGRAILHWNEVTYCAVVPVSLGSPRAVYAMINEALLDGIRAMGIPAVLSGSDVDLRNAYSTAGGVPCFSFSVKSEVQVAGRKLVGSAQRRFGNAILQHGSFLLGPEHRELARFVRASGDDPPDGVSARITADLESRTTDARTVLGRPVPFEEAAGAIAAGFGRYFSRTPAPRDLPGPWPAPSTFTPQDRP
jgi:lipoyl(octanoyl) transferase